MKLCRNIHRSVWQHLRGWNKFKMAAVAMVTKVQTNLNSLQTWHKNRSLLKVVLFVFKIFKMATNIKIKKIVKYSKMKRFQWKWIFTGSKICCSIIIVTISVCYGGHFESKMIAKIQKSSDLGEIWYYYRHDGVKNWALIISCYVLTLFFIHTTSTCIVHLGDICNALCYSNQYFVMNKFDLVLWNKMSSIPIYFQYYVVCL